MPLRNHFAARQEMARLKRGSYDNDTICHQRPAKRLRLDNEHPSQTEYNSQQRDRYEFDRQELWANK